MRFDHENYSQRVHFAPGEASDRLTDEIRAMGSTRALVIASPRDAAGARRITAGIDVAVWHDEVVMHVPVDVADRARDVASDHDIDALVCIGGGSATGLAKAVALTTGIPIVAIPTTYAGSEATNVWGITEGGSKKTGIDTRVLPVAVIYDAALTMSLPVDLSIASGLNALAHCVDALWGPRVDPIDIALAAEAMRALRTGLPLVRDDASSGAGREHLLYGSYLAAVSFASAGSGLHHKICHVLGGMFDVPHAQTHAVVLPHVLSFNAPNAPAAVGRIRDAFGADDAVDGLIELYRDLNAPRALRDLSMPFDGIDRAVPAILDAAPPSNPTPVTEQNITALLLAAWKGTDLT